MGRGGGRRGLQIYIFKITLEREGTLFRSYTQKKIVVSQSNLTSTIQSYLCYSKTPNYFLPGLCPPERCGKREASPRILFSKLLTLQCSCLENAMNRGA